MKDSTQASWIDKALELAVVFHKGQVDKGGTPYILHPIRVMSAVDSPLEKIVAVMHDLVEDTDLTIEDIATYGFPRAVIAALDHLTRREGERYLAYIERVGHNSIARKVKIADLEDNMDIRRLVAVKSEDKARLAKYQQAWTMLKTI